MNLLLIMLGILFFCCVMAYFMPTHWTQEVDITNANDSELENIFEEVTNDN